MSPCIGLCAPGRYIDQAQECVPSQVDLVHGKGATWWWLVGDLAGGETGCSVGGDASTPVSKVWHGTHRHDTRWWLEGQHDNTRSGEDNGAPRILAHWKERIGGNWRCRRKCGELEIGGAQWERRRVGVVLVRARSRGC